MRALDSASTGMQAQQTNVEVISNNIANMTTTGFKRQRAEFQDLIYQDGKRGKTAGRGYAGWPRQWMRSGSDGTAGCPATPSLLPR